MKNPAVCGTRGHLARAIEWYQPKTNKKITCDNFVGIYIVDYLPVKHWIDRFPIKMENIVKSNKKLDILSTQVIYVCRLEKKQQQLVS